VKERVNKTSDTRTGMRMYRMGQHTLRYEWEGYPGICGFCFSTFDLASVALIEIPRYHSRYRRVRAYAVIERGQVNWRRMETRKIHSSKYKRVQRNLVR
jgi:hypothetical protein